MANAFAGIVYPDVFQVTDLIEPMLSPLKHRASGSKHFFTFRNFQLGCYGDGFSSNAKKNIFLCLDGWIENSASLQKEINGENLSQEETLIECYKKFGIEFLQKLNGEFALVLFDQEKGHLYLARDPIGKKPLYWYHDKSYFLFASEIKALLASGIVPQTLAPDAISSYLFFGYSPQDITVIRDVNKLLPAHYLFLNNLHSKQILPYWSYSSYFQKRVHQHKSTIIKNINHLLEKSVSARIPPTGPLGCIVSGGLGSGTIAYYISRIADERDIKAFTVGFGEESEEDIESAELVSNSLHINQSIGEISPQFFIENYATIAWYLDEPIADPNVLATFKLAQNARLYTKTVYSGMGSDELLAGHSRYSLDELEMQPASKRLIPKSIIQKILPILKHLYPSGALDLLKKYRTNPRQFEYLRRSAIFNEEEILKASPNYAGFFDPETFLNKFFNLSRIHSDLSSFLYFDVKTRLPDLFIHQYERLMSAQGINWQTPFLDKTLVEYIAEIPAPEMIAEFQTASYLKPLIENVFPKTFINRPKKTRKNFLASWVDNKEFAHIFYLLRRGTLVETGLISEEWLEKQLSSPEQMKISFSQLFSVLALEVWFRLFINRSISPSPPSLPLDQLLRES